MKIFIGTDHAGYELKEKLKNYLSESGMHQIEDMGAFEFEKDDDYPDFIKPVAQAVANDPESMGIVLGSSGQGEQICANKVPGARAALYYGGKFDSILATRKDNNANILSLAAHLITEDEAKQALDLFIRTPFSGDERHVRRIAKI